MSHRIAQVNALIQRELGKIIAEHLEVRPGVLATISRVETSADLRNAKVFVSVYPEDQGAAVLELLERRRVQLQRWLSKAIILKRLPVILWKIDSTEVQAAHLESLLDELKDDPPPAGAAS